MNYWKLREIRERLRLYDLTDKEIEALLRKEYLRAYKEVKAELDDLLLHLPPDATPNDIFKGDRLYKLLSQIENKLDALGVKENKALTESMSNLYRTTYETVLSGRETAGIGLDDSTVLNAINSVWAGDGMNFSDRIWKSKRLLIERLRTGLVNSISTGANWQDLSKEIQKSFGVSYSQAQRLVRTELSHVQVKSTLDKYQAEGVTKVRYLAEADCCEHCREHNGKVYDIDKAPIIPMHPRCKCTYLPVL